MNFFIWGFDEICWENSSFIKIGQEWRVLYLKTNIHLLSYLAYFFLEWEMFQKKVVKKIKIHFVFSNFFENRAVYETMCEKYRRAGRALYAGYLRLQIHTIRLCNTLQFSTATMVARTCLNVTLYVQCLSCFFSGATVKNRSLASSLFEDSESHTIRHRHTHPLGLLWKNYQPVAEAAVYTTHNIHKRQTSTPSAGFEPVIPAVNRPQNYALDRKATGRGW